MRDPRRFLYLDQVEEMGLEAPPPIDDRRAHKTLSWRDIILGVNNVAGQEGFSREHVVGVLTEKFSALEAVNKASELRLAILELSGYELKKKPELVKSEAAQAAA